MLRWGEPQIRGGVSAHLELVGPLEAHGGRREDEAGPLPPVGARQRQPLQRLAQAHLVAHQHLPADPQAEQDTLPLEGVERAPEVLRDVGAVAAREGRRAAGRRARAVRQEGGRR
eukprot:COSAG04_NODE_4240_length_2212_cov_12.780880_1_plen_114_part_10